MRPTLPTLLSFNGGYVDSAGYLALQGLFAAHVTGNFVTLGAALVFGASGVLAKVLALPVFCGIIIATRLAGFNAPAGRWPMLETLLTLELLLLIASAGLAMGLGPFANGDTLPALCTGMTLVAAMAIQNAAHRIHLGSAPPSTVMTSTTTQISIDVADVLHGLPAAARDAARARLRQLIAAAASFAAGAAAAALLFKEVGVWCFLVPPGVAVLARIASSSLRRAAG